MENKPKWEVEALPPGSRFSRVFSPTNIAWAKYWGKRDSKLNLPTNGSISATLNDFGSFTTVSFDSSYSADRLILNGSEQTGGKSEKVFAVIREIRALAGVRENALVQSRNNFPTAAGLASSASGLSAVTFAAANALGVGSRLSRLSEIARRGSGSACRSLFGGYVEWSRGELPNGSDSIAKQIAHEDHWPLKAFLVLVNQCQKHQPSTGGMELTKQTSPYFRSWIEAAETSLTPIRRAILDRDFGVAAKEVEANCLRFHASAIAAFPPIIYWQGGTLDAVHLVQKLRQDGLRTFFTIDAGPNVVVFTEPSDAQAVKSALSTLNGVEILETSVGPGARILADYERN